MKIGTQYSRVQAHVYTLTEYEIKQAVQDYVEKKSSWFRASPATARQEIEIELDTNDGLYEAVLTQRFIYDEAPVSEPLSDDAVAQGL